MLLKLNAYRWKTAVSVFLKKHQQYKNISTPLFFFKLIKPVVYYNMINTNSNTVHWNEMIYL